MIYVHLLLRVSVLYVRVIYAELLLRRHIFDGASANNSNSFAFVESFFASFPKTLRTSRWDVLSYIAECVEEFLY